MLYIIILLRCFLLYLDFHVPLHDPRDPRPLSQLIAVIKEKKSLL